MAGFWISAGIAIAIGLIILFSLLGSSVDDIVVEDNSVLHIVLKGEIPERGEKLTFENVIRDGIDSNSSLEEIMTALRLASSDPKISCVYLDCDGSALGVASRQELLQALEEFKKSGKKIYAYADTYDQGDYFVATAADEINLNPMGSINLHGISTVTPFFKDLLDRLGVKVQIVKVGTFKSAVEPFVLNSMSEPARLQTRTFVDSIWSDMTETIAQNRNIVADSVRILATQMLMARRAEYILDAGLADNLTNRHDMEQKLREASGLGADEDLRLVSPADYIAYSKSTPMFSDELQSKPHIAVLYAVGDIVDDGDGGIVGRVMAPEIYELADDDNVKGLVLRVNSGGGSAFASEQIWSALEYFKAKDKPFYVSMGDYAASGGYYISCGADRIFADATTLTGSIGVFGMIPDLSGLVTDKFGIHFTTIESNPNASGINIMGPMNEYQLAAMQASVEDIYDTFTSRVAQGRDMPVEDVREIAEGRVWVGSEALRLGLVDDLGTLNDAVEAISSELGMNPGDVVNYPVVEDDFFARLLRDNMTSGSVESALSVSGLDLETYRLLKFVSRLKNMNPVQARMEETTVR